MDKVILEERLKLIDKAIEENAMLIKSLVNKVSCIEHYFETSSSSDDDPDLNCYDWDPSQNDHPMDWNYSQKNIDVTKKRKK